MATQAEASEPKAAADGGKTKLVPIVGAALVAMLLGGAGTWFFLKPSAPKDAKGEPAAASDEASGGETPAKGADGEAAKGAATGEHAPFSDRLITLEPFVVNLDESGAKRFLKTRIELETGSPAAKAELETRSAQMRDAIIVLLTSKRLDDLSGYEGKVILKDEIARRLNDLLGKDEIKSVLITEFVIQ